MKTYYSAEDIENFAARGQGEISVDENVVLTDLAKQTAHMLGLHITQKRPGLSPDTAASAAGKAPAFSGKPKGCQRRPLQKPATAAGKPAGKSPQVVEKLVEKIKRIKAQKV